MTGEQVNGNESVILEARQLGWVPKEEWRGDPDRWTDAESFVNRGHEVMPILKANNARLVGQVGNLEKEAGELRRLLKESQDSIEELKTFSAEITATRVKEVKTEILAKLKKAKEDGDTEAEVLLTDELTDLKAAEREQRAAPKKEEPKPSARQDDVDPEFTAWTQVAENSWFGRDNRKTALAIEIAKELRSDPKNKSVIGTAFYDMVGEEVAKVFGGEPARGTSKVEGSRGGSGGSGGSSAAKGKGYNDLPADAKAICDKQGKQFIGKSGFKTDADWRSYYCKHYFAGEE